MTAAGEPLQGLQAGELLGELSDPMLALAFGQAIEVSPESMAEFAAGLPEGSDVLALAAQRGAELAVRQLLEAKVVGPRGDLLPQLEEGSNTGLVGLVYEVARRLADKLPSGRATAKPGSEAVNGQ